MPIEPTATVDDDDAPRPSSAEQDWVTLPNYVWKALTNRVRGPPPRRPRRDSGDDEEGDATTPACVVRATIEAGGAVRRRRGPVVPRTIDVVRASEERGRPRPLASGEEATTIEAAAAARRRGAVEGRDDDFRVSKPNSKDERRITVEFDLSTDFSLSAPTLGRSGLRWDLDSEEGDSDSSSESSGPVDRPRERKSRIMKVFARG